MSPKAVVMTAAPSARRFSALRAVRRRLRLAHSRADCVVDEAHFDVYAVAALDDQAIGMAVLLTMTEARNAVA